MSVSSYIQHVQNKTTPQSQPIPGSSQVPNSAGGFTWEVDCWTKMDRFLVLGAEGGSYYATEREMTIKSAGSVQECFSKDPARTIARIVEISDKGLAPKNDPAIFALAILSQHREALNALPSVCRIGTHLFQFVDAASKVRGWGSAFKRAVSDWYISKGAENLAYQVVKYQNRVNWTHHDVLHKCHAKPPGPGHQAVFRWAKDKSIAEGDLGRDYFPNLLAVYNEVHAMVAPGPLPESGRDGKAIEKRLCELIVENRLTREMLPTQWLNSVAVWEALLENMPLTAMIRSLGKMSAVGLMTPNSDTVKTVCERLNADYIRKSRVHPITLLLAASVYGSGRGVKGDLSWTVSSKVVGALDEAFYKAFENVEPTGKRYLLALDVSGSMGCGQVAGTPMTPAMGAAAMAMVTLRSEEWCETMGFSHTFVKLNLHKNQSLQEAMAATARMNFGGTDCSLPMIWALQNKIPVDVFVTMTDNETWAGNIHPAQALKEYRQRMGINAKSIVMAFTSNEFSIADPNDPGSLDIVGFSADVPKVISEFSKDGL
jgi:60 kDa SS-A/Ro ribonucleoprotein